MRFTDHDGDAITVTEADFATVLVGCEFESANCEYNPEIGKVCAAVALSSAQARELAAELVCIADEIDAQAALDALADEIADQAVTA